MKSFAQALFLATSLSSSSANPPTSTIVSRQANSQKNFVVFGDSYSTVGFWPGGELPAAGNPLGNPLGNPSLPGQTTANGLNWIGYLTSTLNTSLVLTYDFAVTGSTIDKEIVDTYSQYNVDDQVDQYKQYVSGGISAADTLVAIWVGINDVGEPFWDRTSAPIDQIMDRYFGLLQTLADEGLDNFALLTVPPFSDQIPAMIGQSETDLQSLRSDIAAYNEALVDRLATFKSSNSGIKALVFDTKPSFDTVVNNFAQYGARDATCSGGSDCLWTDSYHAGQAIHKLLAQNFAEGVAENFIF